MLNVQCPTAVPGPGFSLPSPPLTLHGLQGVSVRAGGVLRGIRDEGDSRGSACTGGYTHEVEAGGRAVEVRRGGGLDTRRVVFNPRSMSVVKRTPSFLVSRMV